MLNIKSLALAAGLALISAPAFAWVHGTSAQLFTVTCHGTDDSSAINAAIDSAQTAWTATNPAAVYIPTGICKYKTFHATMTKPVSLIGDGVLLSIIQIDPTNGGDVFSWSDAWQSSSYSPTGNSITPSVGGQVAGVHVEGIAVTGSRTAASDQHAFTFYDHADFVYFNDVFVSYLKGGCLRMGRTLNDAGAYLRESEFYALRCWMDGDTSQPVVDIDSQGSGDATNEVAFYNLSIFAFYGPGVDIRSNGSAATRALEFFNLRVEQNSGVTANVDDLVIGDATETGTVNSINFYSPQLFQSSASAYALHTISATAGAGTNTYGLNFWGGVASNASGDTAIYIQAGRSLMLGFWNVVAPSGTGIKVGPTTGGISSPITVDAGGLESGFTYSLDATITANNVLRMPAYVGVGATPTSTARVYRGSGAPAFAAAIGSLYERTDGGAGTSLYVNETGASGGWVGK